MIFSTLGSPRSSPHNDGEIRSNNSLSSSVFVSSSMPPNSSSLAQNASSSSEASGGDLASINASRLRNGGNTRNSSTKVVIQANTESTL